MKKIINGKLYNTETAQLIGSWDNNHPYNDFGYCGEDLYRKRTGEFFLHGEGGPMSKYAEAHGDNEWGWGEEIIPLTYDAARKWAERLDPDDYQKIFGEISEDDEKTTLTLSVSTSAAEKARRAAAQKGVGLSAYIESLI